MRSAFQRRPVKSLTLSDVNVTLAEDGPSHAVDLSPSDFNVWFTNAEGTRNTPGAIWGGKGPQSPAKDHMRFTGKGWSSYAARTFCELEEGTKRRQQAAPSESILRLLRGTSTETANELLYDWHKKSCERDPDPRRLIVRNKTNEVRLVTTSAYALYENQSFWRDVQAVKLEGAHVQNVLVDEDLFSVRFARPLGKVGSSNLFFGLELLNSENGSASTRASYILYDLVCTNGMFVDLGELSVFRKIHRNWDMDKVRAELQDSVSMVVGEQKNAAELAMALHGKKLGLLQAGDMLQQYRETFDATETFTDLAHLNWTDRQSATAWGLVSAITWTAQGYSLTARRQHEMNAGRFARLIVEGKVA